LFNLLVVVCVSFHSDISKVHIYTAESLPTKPVLEIDFFMSKSTDVSFLMLKIKTILPLQFTRVQNVHKMSTSLGFAVLGKVESSTIYCLNTQHTMPSIKMQENKIV
jgi:hypothetical protein